MKPLRMFEYMEPRDLKEASSLLRRMGKSGKILAGGTDAMSCWSARTFHVGCYTAGIEPPVLKCFGPPKKPRALINIKTIPGLKGIKKKGKSLRVGALTTLNELAESSEINNGLSLLRNVAGRMGSVEIRNLATVGGNLFTHAPAAGLAPLLLCIGAKGVISDGVKRKEISLEDLFGGFGKLNQLPRLPDGQILVEIIIPELRSGSGAGYEKTTVMVSSMSPPVASAAAMVGLDTGGRTIKDCRIYVGGCTPSYPHRGEKAEAYLVNKPVGEEILREASQMAVSTLKPISDNYGSAEYRALVASVVVRRALKQAVQAAQASFSH